jgi:predicted phage terminase large subunit-like protein
MTDSAAKPLLRAISEDRALGSAVLFGHRHPYPSPAFHVTVMDAWRSADEFVLIEAFREGAKTTLAEEFLTMEGAFGNFFYTVIFGETYAKACQKIEAIAYEARTNVKLLQLFGKKILARKPIENKIWFASGALIECAGWEQEITGFKYLDRRPDRAYLDDVENLERVRSSDAVDATMRKLYSEVLPALDKTRRKVRVTETPRAADCMVTRLRANPDWICLSFPICDRDVDDPESQSAWPQRYPMSWIRNERDRYERAGMLRQFQQEFLLNVDSAESKPFAEDMLRFVEVAPAAWLARKAIYDPARTPNAATSARTGKVVVSRQGTRLIVHESNGAFWKPDELRTDIFETWERHHCAQIAIEKDSLDEYLMQPLRYEMLRRGVMLPVKELRAPQDRDKETFIMGLQPFFKAGDIVLVGGRGMHTQLVSELLNFPKGRKDIVNALAYALIVFSGDTVYQDFGEQNIGPAPRPGAGETVTTCWNASSAEVVCAVMLRRGQVWHVTHDFAAGGPTSDAVKTVLAGVKAAYPRNRFDAYVPPELHDAWNRVPLVPALKGQGLNAWRGEHLAVARGKLADPIRTVMRGGRLLMVTKDAPLTLAALSCDYKYPIQDAGKPARDPEPGLARLIGEAIESAYAVLARTLDADADWGTHYAVNPQGVRYATALPQRTR